MLPIIGDRYNCVDCLEKIGFDLCGECYNSSSKLPGRFNQQHRPEHKFVLVDYKHLFIPPEHSDEISFAMRNYVGISDDESQECPTDTDTEENDGNN